VPPKREKCVVRERAIDLLRTGHSLNTADTRLPLKHDATSFTAVNRIRSGANEKLSVSAGASSVADGTLAN